MAIACNRVKVQKEKRMCVNIPIRDLSISFHFVLQIRYEDNVVAQQQQKHDNKKQTYPTHESMKEITKSFA